MTTLTITIPDELDATHTRFQTENGAQWADAYVEAKLREIQERHNLSDALDTKARIDALPANEKSAIQVQLDAVVFATLPKEILP